MPINNNAQIGIFHANKLNYALFLSLLFILSFFLFYPAEISVWHDMASYLAIAQNFVSGNGMIDIQGNISNHRFGYKLLLSLALSFGETPQEGLAYVWGLQSLFCALLAVVLFVFAQKLFDTPTALLSYGLFMLCPSVMNSLALYGLDGFWPLFVLISLLCYLRPFNQEQPAYRNFILPIIAGVFAGFAIWTKESGGLNYTIIPLLLLLFKCSDNSIKKCLLFYGSLLVMMFLGHFVIELLGGSMGQDSENERRSFKSALFFAQGAYHSNAVLSVCLFLLDGVRGYFIFSSTAQNMHHFYPVFFMIFFSVAYALYDTIKNKNISSRILLILMLVYLPYIAWAAQWNMRPFQLVLTLCVVSILIARFSFVVFFFLKREEQLCVVEGQTLKACTLNSSASIFIVSLLFFQYTSSRFEPFYLDDNPLLNKTVALSQGYKDVSLIHKGLDLSKADIFNQVEGARPLVVTENIVEASGAVFYKPSSLITKVSLYKRIMLGVHENPYVPYLLEDEFNDIAFLCLQQKFNIEGKRHIESFAFLPEALKADVKEFDGDVYVVTLQSGDCTPLLKGWVDVESNAHGLIFSKVSDPALSRYLIYRITLNADQSVGLTTPAAPVVRSHSFSNYMAHLKRNDGFSFSYYVSNYPFVE